MPFTQKIQQIPAGGSITIDQPQMHLNGEFLAGLTERLNGLLTIQLTKDEEVLVRDYTEASVLAFDQWHGSGFQQEVLCAFITPNHPEVAKIVARATEILGDWTGNTAMSAYQSNDPNRVLQQAGAIFTAIKEQDIAYVTTAASFEESGQRVRLCDTIMQQKMGNCLDMTLLYASCLEAVGLHPLLVMMDGHIFTGVWLEEKYFPEVVYYDKTQLTKRLADGVNEIAVMESTLATNGHDASFDEARKSAEKQLAAGKFHAFYDVHRARSQVFPLPMRIKTDAGWEIQHDTTFSREKMKAPTQLGETIHVDALSEEEKLPKMEQWERKLLDLTLNNKLLNLKLGKKHLPLLTDSLDTLEDALAEDTDFSILPKPSDLSLSEVNFESLQEQRDITILAEEFKNKRLRAAVTEGELKKSMTDLYRSAKTALEENGANTLYLSLGVLKWYDVKKSTRPVYAPIILLPVEIVRKSAAAGYTIRRRDDEPQMNITLLEKIKQDYGITVNGLDPLPTDDHGIDIRRVLTIINRAVMSQEGWDVLEVATLGIFSFSQFVMWNDLHNRAGELTRNKIVRSLIDKKLAWEATSMQIGDRVSEDNVLLPMPADASQLYAIQAACSGESFVLQGPPGTGKSQTITSLIANALAQGKSVLFVAEKMAALEVVQKRLDSIGIGPFCLELHSNKAKKRNVLDQLQQAIQVTKNQSPAAYAAKAKQLAAMRAELDTYARQLHQLQPCGKDLYSLINEYEIYRDAPLMKRFDRTFIRGLNNEALEQQRLSLERLVAAAKEAGAPSTHPLRRITCTEYTQDLRANAPEVAEAYAEQIGSIRTHAAAVVEALSQPMPNGYNQLKQLAELAGHLTNWYDVPAVWAQAPQQDAYYNNLKRFCVWTNNAGKLKGSLLEHFQPEILDLNGQQLLNEYKLAAQKWFLPKFFGINKLVKTLRLYANTPVNKGDVETYLTTLKDYQKAIQESRTLEATCAPDLGALYRGADTDWVAVVQRIDNAKAAAQAIYELSGTYQIIHDLGGKEELKDAIVGLHNGLAAFNKAKLAFDTLLLPQKYTEENWLDSQQSLCEALMDRPADLREWIAYAAAAADVEALGLSNVIQQYNAGADHEDILPAYHKTLLEGLISEAIDSSDSLNKFTGGDFNKKIQQYKEADAAWTALSKEEIYCRMASRVPDFTAESNKTSEVGILQRNIKSGGRGTSLRKLFEQIPNLLPLLCPCMLMSPISAAQYLDPNRAPFDIVVFDEASQLPTCKAVGVLARGENAVIVGDDKQMPPTSFFASKSGEDDETIDADDKDMESILDDCIALNMPQTELLWHYRSRHESLIAFSNRQFYSNKLFTFPSVNDRETKVRAVQVEGLYDRGGKRTNQVEAEAIVAEVQRRAKDPELSKLSVGIITFNINQQHLIDDLLTEACRQDPQLEQWMYGDQAKDPLFVKNLENVQGDERDVILFSVNFSPDADGRLNMDFGPINRDGGWRRLNVAVSRARHEMVVFTSVRSDQLDLSRTSSEGVAHLRKFLEYAEGRAGALADPNQPDMTVTEGIANSICAALEEEGYETDIAVGRSEYRVDIGVVNPEHPDQYLLGIVLDGASYGAAKTTRDRELAQINVLKGLGWNILRVWCMDWWSSSDKEIARILAELETLRENGGTPPEEPEEDPVEEIVLPTPSTIGAPIAPVEPKAAPFYEATELPVRQVSTDDLMSAAYTADLARRLTAVLEKEAPIHRALLFKRVAQSYGVRSVSANSRLFHRLRTITRNLKIRPHVTKVGEDVIYWTNDQRSNTYRLFRVNGTGANHRDIQDIPPQEIANAIYVVLKEQFSIDQEALLREIAKKLGYARVGSNVQSVLLLGLEQVREQGGITTGVNGTLMLTDKGLARAKAILQSF